MTPENAHRCWAEIDLAALERNLGRIRAGLPRHIRYVAVVKADAYGHGIHQTVARLMQCGADAFAVANVREAVEIREIGAGWPILILGPVLAEESPYLIDYDLVATVSTEYEVDMLETLAHQRQTRIRIHLKIDTGMGRLGVWHSEALRLFNRLVASPHLLLEGIYTHFSKADSDPEFTLHQRQLFLNTLRTFSQPRLEPLLIHADNSAGLETVSRDTPFNAVRVGLLQFGHHPYPASLLATLKVEPVLSFHTRIGITKKLPRGCSLSYGGTFTLKRDSRIAVLTAGYGDGLPTASSNRGTVLVRDQRCPILGRVTMDQTLVDITDLPEALPGDKVTLIGRQGNQQINLAEFSEHAACIPWEALCSITKRVPRLYRTSRIT